MATAIAERKKVKTKPKPKPVHKSKTPRSAADRIPKRYDRENGGFRPMTAGWAVFQVMKEACDKEFDIRELTKKSIVFCKQQRIKFEADSKIAYMLWLFQQMGIVKRLSRGEYRKTI